MTGAKIKNGTVRSADLAPGVAVSGPAGPRGATGAPGSALAYGFIQSDGNLDPTASKNIASVQVVDGGYACFDLAVPVHDIQLTWAGNSADPTKNDRLLGLVGQGPCDDEHSDAFARVLVYAHDGTITDSTLPYYVTFD